MERKAIRGIMLTLLLISILTLAFNTQVRLVEASTLTPRSPIFINGDAGFIPANGVTSGSGTASDPYIIESWDINAATAHGIEIRNTTAYFIIRNVTVHDGKPNNYLAIRLHNVTHGIVTNVTSTNNVEFIVMTRVSNSRVLNNTALDDGRIQIYEESHHNTIAFNYLWSPARPYPQGASCIGIGESDYNDVIGNRLVNWGGNGIGVGLGSFNNIINNTVSNGQWYAIILSLGGQNTVVGNDVSGGVEGIALDGSYGNNITGNHAHNTGSGITMYYGVPSTNNYIVGNIIEDNYYGIISTEAPNSGNHIYNNYLRNSVNVYDDGVNNWNTSKTLGTNILGGPYLGGNYYSDYTGTDADHDGIGDTPYYISGGGCVDYLPLVSWTPPPTPPVGGNIVPVNKLVLLGPWIVLAVAVMGAAVSVAVYRKKYRGF